MRIFVASPRRFSLLIVCGVAYLLLSSVLTGLYAELPAVAQLIREAETAAVANAGSLAEVSGFDLTELAAAKAYSGDYSAVIELAKVMSPSFRLTMHREMRKNRTIAGRTSWHPGSGTGRRHTRCDGFRGVPGP